MISFFLIVLLIWTGMHAYVFWRLSGLPWVQGSVPHWAIWLCAFIAWAGLPAMLLSTKTSWSRLSAFLEAASTNWLGCLFLLLVSLLAAEVLSLGGWLFPSHAPYLRLAAVFTCLILCVIAFIQGSRVPVVRNYEVSLPGLPRERDGLKLLVLSDLHLGSQLGENWLARLITRVEELKPDLIVIAGDLVDRDAKRVLPMVDTLKGLQAPLGVWAVQGNHDVFGGAELSEQIMRASGFHVLRDESVLAVPGLRIAGVDDLGLRARSRLAEPAVTRALSQLRRGEEACIYISHTPDLISKAAREGAGLMLCGHTHGGQIWPFSYLVALRYKTLEGRHDIDGMTLLVSRGAGTWGPRMRLWSAGELLLVRLRTPVRP